MNGVRPSQTSWTRSTCLHRDEHRAAIADSGDSAWECVADDASRGATAALTADFSGGVRAGVRECWSCQVTLANPSKPARTLPGEAAGFMFAAGRR